ncbi:seryl-tRNA synthetase [Kitasatospora gansuensis]|uniref:Serine--tRNA ligase n=1 Tax=Kitasatospora gansuensis TaxID=258050 RepID=A0A7W7SBM5_9ACTN|nr:serine--tRNA ligase [Kitasatospora gansuensis]MBB4947499.1 seryl-tRNA synthetase [Kitasatospora gansuensis]
MMNLELIRTNPDAVKRAAAAKRVSVDIDELIELDQKSRRATEHLDGLRHTLKTVSRQVGAGGEGREQAKALGDEIRVAELEQRNHRGRLDTLLSQVPNILAPEVPEGDDDSDNLEIRRWGTPRSFDFPKRDHLELMLDLGMVNLDGPRQFAGARSYALTGPGAMLELAVLRYAMDTVVAKGFTPVIPPVIVREQALFGTGFFPGSREETYQLPADDLYLVGTSEVGLVAMHSDSILSEEQLPIRYAGWSPCFRREAGSAGRDSRGLYRVHQFTKVEQVVICHNDPVVSEREHYGLLGNAEAILQGLDLPHRVALACSGETGLGQYRKHEVETWMPSRDSYSETHSCSTMLDFQGRRSRIRYRSGKDKIFAHTLNNTAVASPRILVAIVENYQNADGTVTVPEVLRPYMYGLEVISK